MFDPQQKRHLKARAELDRVEASSEQARDAGVGMAICFTEGARKGWERFADFLALPEAKQREILVAQELKRMEHLLPVLQKLQQSNPSELICAALGRTMEHGALYKVVLQTSISSESPAVHRVCYMLHEPGLSEPRVTSDRVLLVQAKLTQENIDFGLKLWFKQFFPAFSDLPVTWCHGSKSQMLERLELSGTCTRAVIARPEILKNISDGLRELVD